MPHSLYLHVPFCTHRCAYCDFNTYAGQGRLIPAYVDALCREITYVGRRSPADIRIHTIFLGGGTPSLLTPDQVRQLIGRIQADLRVDESPEITLEANPGTVTAGDLQQLRMAGVNRISFGVQSANGEELRILERTHGFGDVLCAASDARRAGFSNLNVDLIYGLPGQEMSTWQNSVRRILKLETEHISAYALTMEHGTPFGQWTQRGLMVQPDPDLAADMYEWLCYALAAAGYMQYEISNWAVPGNECLHNLQYWRSGPYLGLGAGAHGYEGGRRYSNVLPIGGYIGRMMEAVGHPRDYPCSPALANQHLQTAEDEMGDFMMMGLRLTQEGVTRTRFHTRFGCDLLEIFGPEIENLVQAGLLEWILYDADHETGSEGHLQRGIRLTKRGRLLGNRVFSEFLSVQNDSQGRRALAL